MTLRAATLFNCLLIALIGLCRSAWAEIEITGLDPALEPDVLAALALNREACDAPEWRVNALFQRARQDIQFAVEANGYYAPTIESTIDFGEACWVARFEIDSGAPVLLREVSLGLRGAAEVDAEFQQVVSQSALTNGERLDHRRYESLKTSLLDLSRRKGYAEARFSENRIDVYPEAFSADISLEFESGPRYGFGDIRFVQDFLNADLVEGFADIEMGAPFDRRELSELYNGLVDSGYFGLIDVRPLAPDPVSQQIPVQIELTPGNRKILSYGGGFATDSGPRLRISRTNRRLNARGAQLNLNAELSPVISEFTVTHRFPYGDPRTEWISFDAGLKREDTDTSNSNAVEFGARRIIKRWQNWQETQFIDFLVEDFEIAGDEDRSRLLQPGISWFRVRADNTIRPDKGDRLAIEVLGAADNLGSDTSFFQTNFDGRWIWSLNRGARILTRARLGMTWNDDFDELPPSIRYFAGGDSSVRGYDFHSQGPVDSNGEVIGGDRLVVASIEYEYPIKEAWSVATFYDAGNAFHDNDLNAVAGAGIGARWVSPLGPIRIDLARPLDGLDRDIRLHISLGPDL